MFFNRVSDDPKIKPVGFIYAVEDRIPRVYPWMNEPEGGTMGLWKLFKRPIVFIVSSTMLYG